MVGIQPALFTSSKLSLYCCLFQQTPSVGAQGLQDSQLIKIHSARERPLNQNPLVKHNQRAQYPHCHFFVILSFVHYCIYQTQASPMAFLRKSGFFFDKDKNMAPFKQFQTACFLIQNHVWYSPVLFICAFGRQKILGIRKLTVYF